MGDDCLNPSLMRTWVCVRSWRSHPVPVKHCCVCQLSSSCIVFFFNSPISCYLSGKCWHFISPSFVRFFFFFSCLFLSRRPRPPHPDRRGNSHSAVTSKWFHPLPVFQLMMCRLPSSFDVEWSCMCVRWERRRRKNKVGPEIRKNPHVLLLDDYESIQKSCVFHVLSERRVHWRFEGPPV